MMKGVKREDEKLARIRILGVYGLRPRAFVVLPRRGTRGIEAELVFDRVIHYRIRGKGVSSG